VLAVSTARHRFGDARLRFCDALAELGK